ncbi:hypothetical protein CI105_04585 [Candidatus Izimaplasma bacterium ZiA1]|uniref:tRNA(His) guanylyltransferase Thg1 family protein n=1 Tax=Candidatus Izimoplasma sp. ZiA1 TaxID=2024899 RepID=UPI000BAA8A40|nr:hypothetical protein CI105_04585 [Candidatus Izimaplasma bacterium ZiA1]
MSNNSGNKIEWDERDMFIEDGWWILKIDGSKFKPLRYPNLSLDMIEKYYIDMCTVGYSVMRKFKHIIAAYILDDEFHFLFKTSEIQEDKCRLSKVLVWPTSYTTALVNSKINSKIYKSNKTISFNELCYDGRLIRLEEGEIECYFYEIINHGKLFIGNSIEGDGEYYIDKTLSGILKIARDKNVKLTNMHNLLFGRFITRFGANISMDDFKYEKHQNVVKRELKDIVSRYNK